MLPAQPDILIVDDERTTRLMLRTALETAGFAVREARDGSSALEEVRDQVPHVVLLDLWMPKQDGLSVLRQIKAEMRGGRPGIIILTGYGNVALTVQAIRAGASDLIHKPPQLEEVRSAVQAVLDELHETSEPAASHGPGPIIRLARREIARSNFRCAEELLEASAKSGPRTSEYYKTLALLNDALGRPRQASRCRRKAALRDGAPHALRTSRAD